jgi:fructose-1,6-bisphosphatase/inositol monophosphatase family enzyme
MSLSGAEIDAVVALLREVSGTEIMPRFRKLSAEDIRLKSGPQDPVTIADEAAEKALAAGLRKLFPGSDVIGEEAVSENPDLLSRLTQPGKIWVIDPIDGTANYASDLPLFGVILALVEADKTLAGFIHDPVGDDTAIAIAGGGAWMQLRDGSRKTLRVSAPLPVKQMTGSVSWRFLPQPLRSRVMSRLDRLAAAPDYRCAAHQYRMLAAGHAQCQLFRKLLPWDHAAGVLLHQEAGGYSAHFDGTQYRPSHTTGGLLLAPDANGWLELKTALLDD